MCHVVAKCPGDYKALYLGSQHVSPNRQDDRLSVRQVDVKLEVEVEVGGPALAIIGLLGRNCHHQYRYSSDRTLTSFKILRHEPLSDSTDSSSPTLHILSSHRYLGRPTPLSNPDLVFQ